MLGTDSRGLFGAGFDVLIEGFEEFVDMKPSNDPATSLSIKSCDLEDDVCLRVNEEDEDEEEEDELFIEELFGCRRSRSSM